MEGISGAAAVEEVNGAIAVEEVHGAAAVEEVHGAAAVNSLNGAVVNPAAPLQGDAFRKAIVRFVILSKLPFGVVESNSFKRICNHLHPHMNIPSVALESIFSTRVRLLDTYMSSLGPRVVEVLICSQNWLKPSEGFEIAEGVVADSYIGLGLSFNFDA